MSQVNRMIVSLLIGGSLICVGYATGQQSQTKQPANQNPKQQQAQSTLLQQVDQIRDQLAQLQAQVKDLQTSIAELQTGQQTAVGSVGDTRLQIVKMLNEDRQEHAQDRQYLAKILELDGKELDGLVTGLGIVMGDTAQTRTDVKQIKIKLGLY